MGPSIQIDARTRIDAGEIAAISQLISAVTEADGLRPLSEHVWLHLRSGGDDRSIHLLARDHEGALVGYAHLDTTDEVDGPSAELAVSPSQRRHGVGRALLDHLMQVSDDPRLRLWAHGEQAGASQLARDAGFVHSRVLWQMRRSLYAPLPRLEVPDGIAIRPFRVGIDEEAWLRVNARAFAGLPDQARWTRADLERRMGEPWFSPEGFLMAWRGDELVGFHWTKVHGGVAGHHHESVGEVYVVGVDPVETGTGLGRAITIAGLAHMRSLDLGQAMLYVDASNERAVRLYETLGFVRWDTDIEYMRPH